MFNILLAISLTSLLIFTISLGVLHLSKMGSKVGVWCERIATHSLIFYLLSSFILLVYYIQNIV